MDDVITLIKTIVSGTDQYANPIETKTEREVFCKVKDITRAEFYQAAQTGLHPSYVFELSNYADYEGEKEVKYTDWTGTEKVFDVLRTYRIKDKLEITVQERVGNGVA